MPCSVPYQDIKGMIRYGTILNIGKSYYSVPYCPSVQIPYFVPCQYGTVYDIYMTIRCVMRSFRDT